MDVFGEFFASLLFELQIFVDTATKTLKGGGLVRSKNFAQRHFFTVLFDFSFVVLDFASVFALVVFFGEGTFPEFLEDVLFLGGFGGDGAFGVIFGGCFFIFVEVGTDSEEAVEADRSVIGVVWRLIYLVYNGSGC